MANADDLSDSDEERTLTDKLQDAVVQLSQQLEEEQLLKSFIEDVFNTTYEPLLILDAEFKVVLANTSFYVKFNTTDEDVLQKPIFSLVDSKLNTPELRTLLDGILLHKSSIKNYKVRIESPAGPRTYFINARSVKKTEGVKKFVFLAFDDATERIRLDEQKTILMNEMNHRIKNNLMVIQTLLKLQAREVEDEVSKGYLNDTQARVQSISLIHEMLYHSQDLSSINFLEYAQKLIASIKNCYSKSSGININLNIPAISLDIDKMLPLGLIITELVTNSYKYAFPDNRTGIIWIDLSCMEDKHFVLTVKDDGVGIPHDFDINKSDSFGMKIVTALVGQINGELELDRDGGTKFVIYFQDEKQRAMHY